MKNRSMNQRGSSSKSRMDERRPSFFKVFIPVLCSQRMQIPPAFAAHYLRGLKIKNATFLRDPRRGNVWPVEISVEGRVFFFEKGWIRFVVDNQIELGDFLVFKLRDKHFFDFKHFGKSGCEKEKCSPFRFTVKQEDLELEGEEEEEEEERAVNNDNFAEEEDHYYDEGEEDGEYEESDDEEEEEEENADDEDEGEEVEKNSEDGGEYEESDNDVEVVELEDNEKNDEENKKKEQESKLGSKKKSTYTPRLTKEDFREIKKEIFDSGVPIPKNPYFVLKIRPQKRGALFIPVGVVRYHDLKLPSEMKIVNEMGKGSKSKVKVWNSGCISLNGWTAFCEYNHVKINDKCLVEFVRDRENKRQLCLQVRIFRA